MACISVLCVFSYYKDIILYRLIDIIRRYITDDIRLLYTMQFDDEVSTQKNKLRVN